MKNDPLTSIIGLALERGHFDDHLAQFASLSDVVKNDLKQTMGWNDEQTNNTLHILIDTCTDTISRYRYRPPANAYEEDKRFSSDYVAAQCLLTEWLTLYRVIQTYVDRLDDQETVML